MQGKLNAGEEGNENLRGGTFFRRKKCAHTSNFHCIFCISMLCYVYITRIMNKSYRKRVCLMRFL